jgi:uncharacterized protein YydD (DUF2326 family)
MIHSVRCDQPSFKNVVFTGGLNVVLAERVAESTEKDSRNGLGKTTLIEIIHFCLGASAVKDKGLLRAPLRGWTFYLDIDLRGSRFTISRNTEKHNRVVVDGDWSAWPIKPTVDTKTNEPSMGIREWNCVLGWLMFDLEVGPSDSKYTPTYRSLISYFVRRGRDAFSVPFEHYRKQLEWDKQINNAYLLGLGWEYAQKWQKLKDQENTLGQLKEAAKSGLMPNLVGSIGELETAKVRLEEQVTRSAQQLHSFKVHPQYREIEQRASHLTTDIQQLVNENVSARRMVEFYESSYQNEQPPDQSLVAEMYEEAGVVLPELIVKQIEDVQEFHQRLITHRKDFLRAEIARLNREVTQREEKIQALSEERASLMSILQAHGALEENALLQQQHTKLVAQLENIKNQIANLEKFEQGKSALRIDQESLLLSARADYDERRPSRDRAISLFNGNSEALYEAPGKLIIDVTPTGYKFQVEIERSDSQGFEQMKVFCYDMMLAQIWAQKEVQPGILIHDSTIFDGVDERQTANALQLVVKSTAEYGFQYICCLNSDVVPYRDLPAGFDIQQYVRRVLTDATDDGGLLGIRF